jgi:hypothetical protein
VFWLEELLSKLSQNCDREAVTRYLHTGRSYTCFLEAASGQLLPGPEVVGLGALQLQPLVEAVLEAAHALRHLLVHEVEGGEAGPVLEAQVRVVADEKGHPLGVPVCGQATISMLDFYL